MVAISLLSLALQCMAGATERQPATDAPARVLALVAGSEQKCRALAAKLQACRAAGQDITYPDASLAVAELFCRFSRHDAGQADLCAAAVRSMEHVDQVLDEELRKADDVLAGRAKYPAIPRWRTAGVTWRDGGLWSGDEPVFLSGFNWDSRMAQGDPTLARRLGINLADASLQGEQRPDGSFDEGGINGRWAPYLRQMSEAGFAVDSLVQFGATPKWLVDATPGLTQAGYSHYGSTVIEHPRAIAHRQALLDHFVPLYAAHPSLFAIDLANEPAYQKAAPLTMENWRAWLKRKYGDVAGLNRAWGTNLGAFDAVVRAPSVDESGVWWRRATVDFSQPGVRGAHYDWCAFNQERVTEHFRRQAERIRAHAPKVATHIKVLMGPFFTGSIERRGWKMDLSYHTMGSDPEALAQFTDLLGCDFGLGNLSNNPDPSPRLVGNAPYAIGWLAAGLTADFHKSLAPDKPFYNSEFHCIEDVDETDPDPSPKEHVETALWLTHLHGMNANLTWFWSRNADGSPMGMAGKMFKGSLLQQPWTLLGHAQQTLSLRRWVRPVMAFPRQPRPVRLLYSEPSAIQDVNYIDALRDAYEAANFLGLSVGVVTERQLAERGVPADTRLLVVPNAHYVQDETVAALRAARARGVMVGIIGEESLTATPTGVRRADAQVPGAERIPMGTPQEYHPRFDAWLRAAGVERELLALDAAGRPAWGIEVRTAREGDQRLAYLVNLMREPITVTLRWRDANARLRDWRTDTSVANQVTLKPRQVVFGAW